MLSDTEGLTRLREICLNLPEASEQGGVGDPTFKVRDKIFAMRHPMDERESMWCKAQAGVQSTLVASEPERFFVPPYVGQHGWIGVWLDRRPPWSAVQGLLEDGYRLVAPKRLLAALDAEPVGRTAARRG